MKIKFIGGPINGEVREFDPNNIAAKYIIPVSGYGICGNFERHTYELVHINKKYWYIYFEDVKIKIQFADVLEAKEKLIASLVRTHDQMDKRIGELADKITILEKELNETKAKLISEKQEADHWRIEAYQGSLIRETLVRNGCVSKEPGAHIPTLVEGWINKIRNKLRCECINRKGLGTNNYIEECNSCGCSWSVGDKEEHTPDCFCKLPSQEIVKSETKRMCETCGLYVQDCCRGSDCIVTYKYWQPIKTDKKK